MHLSYLYYHYIFIYLLQQLMTLVPLDRKERILEGPKERILKNHALEQIAKIHGCGRWMAPDEARLINLHMFGPSGGSRRSWPCRERLVCASLGLFLADMSDVVVYTLSTTDRFIDSPNAPRHLLDRAPLIRYILTMYRIVELK